MKQDRKFLDETFANMFSNPTYSNYLFYAHILGQCSVKIDETIPAPAGVAFVTDHFELFINPEMMSSYPVSTRIGILKHEALHIINGHLGERFKGHILKIMNWATDCAINQTIDRSHLPDGVIYPDTLSVMLTAMNNKHLIPEGTEMKDVEHILKKANVKFVNVPENRTSEEYYNLIMEHIPEEDKNSAKDGEEGEEGEGSGDGEASENSNGKGNQGKSKKSFKPTEPDDHSKFGEGTLSEDFLKERTKNLLDKAREATLATNGSLPQEFSGWLELNSPKKTEVPWQKLFQNVSSNTKKNTRETYMRRSRRFTNRPEIKGKTSDRIFNWLTIADVSGSMPDASVKYCLREIISLCKKMNTTSRLIQVDTNPLPSIEITPNIKKFERKACGGTIMFPGIEQANEEGLDYDAVVILTDGGLSNSDIDSFLTIKKPIIWVVTDDYNESLERFQKGKMKAARLKVA